MVNLRVFLALLVALFVAYSMVNEASAGSLIRANKRASLIESASNRTKRQVDRDFCLAWIVFCETEADCVHMPNCACK